MSVDQSARVRAFELVKKNGGRMLLHEAFETVYRERYGDDLRAILRELAKQAAGSSGALVRGTYHLPDGDDGKDEQLTLIDTPSVIAIHTPDGPQFIHRDQATGREVRQWLQEGHRHHSTQKYRFKNGLKDLEAIDDSELDQPWPELRPVLAERKRAAIEGSS